MTTDVDGNKPKRTRRKLPTSLAPEDVRVVCTRCGAHMLDEVGKPIEPDAQKPCVEGHLQHAWEASPTMSAALLEALKSQFPDAFKPEVIGRCDVEEAANDVLLSVAFSPVIPDRDGFVPCEVVELEPESVNGKYRMYFPAWFEGPHAGTTRDVVADELRVMRARYLLTKGYLHANFAELPHHVQELAIRLFFGGQRPFVPAPGSRLANIPAGGLSIPLKPGQTHADLFAELFSEAGGSPSDMTVSVFPGPNETGREFAARLGFPVPSAELQDARARLLGVLSAHIEPNATTKSTGHPTKKRAPKRTKVETLPIAEAYYSVAQLPATTAPSPNPALRKSDGMVRAVFAVWYSSAKPDITALEPPDELGCFVGAQCAVEAQTSADRLIRLQKGPRSFAWPLPEAFARAVYTDGLRQRTTALTLGGRQAMTELGLRSDDATLADTDVQAMGEARGKAGQSNEEREASNTLGPRGREFLTTWAKDQRAKGDVETKPHITVAANKSMLAVLRILVKRGYAKNAGTDKDWFVLTPDGMIAAADIDRKAAERAAKESNDA